MARERRGLGVGQCICDYPGLYCLPCPACVEFWAHPHFYPLTMVHYAQASLGSLSSRPWDLGKTHPVNHRSHIWAKHIQSTKSHVWAKHTQSTKKVVSGQNTPSQPQKSYLGNHTQSTMKVISGQNTSNQPQKLYLSKTHPKGTYGQMTPSQPQKSFTQSTTKVTSRQYAPS